MAGRSTSPRVAPTDFRRWRMTAKCFIRYRSSFARRPHAACAGTIQRLRSNGRRSRVGLSRSAMLHTQTTVMSKPIVVWGASGHAKVLREFIGSIGYELVATFDNNAD